MINHFKILLYLSKVNREKARKSLRGVRKYWSNEVMGEKGCVNCNVKMMTKANRQPVNKTQVIKT